jgi:hypothetical protein
MARVARHSSDLTESTPTLDIPISSTYPIVQVLLAITSLALLFTPPSVAQSTTGLPPFATVQSGIYDSVKINDGAILLNLPIRTKPGLIPFSYSLNSNIFVQTSSPSGYALMSWNASGLSAWEPQTSIGFSPHVYIGRTGSVGKCPDNKTNTIRYSGYFLADEYGTTYPLSLLKADSTMCWPETLQEGVVGYLAIIQSTGGEQSITDPVGDVLTPTTFTDPNNNELSFTSVCSPSDCGSAGEAYTVTITYTDSTDLTPITEVV